MRGAFKHVSSCWIQSVNQWRYQIGAHESFTRPTACSYSQSVAMALSLLCSVMKLEHLFKLDLLPKDYHDVTITCVMQHRHSQGSNIFIWIYLNRYFLCFYLNFGRTCCPNRWKLMQGYKTEGTIYTIAPAKKCRKQWVRSINWDKNESIFAENKV
jgi:hypothetical protein